MGPCDDLLRNLLNIFKVFEANVIVFGHILIKKKLKTALPVFLITVNSL